VFGFDETVLPRWAHKPCSHLKAFIRENYKDYDAVFLTSLWTYQLSLQDTKADPDYLKNLEATLREISQTVPVYVLSDVPQLPIDPLRQLHFNQLGIRVARQFNHEYLHANSLVKRLVESIPNVHWVDLSRALDGFTEGSIFNGKPTYFDDNHLNAYGARSLGKLFIQSGARLIE